MIRRVRDPALLSGDSGHPCLDTLVSIHAVVGCSIGTASRQNKHQQTVKALIDAISSARASRKRDISRGGGPQSHRIHSFPPPLCHISVLSPLSCPRPALMWRLGTSSPGYLAGLFGEVCVLPASAGFVSFFSRRAIVVGAMGVGDLFVCPDEAVLEASGELLLPVAGPSDPSALVESASPRSRSLSKISSIRAMRALLCLCHWRIQLSARCRRKRESLLPHQTLAFCLGGMSRRGVTD
jgi:hypothetical protein